MRADLGPPLLPSEATRKIVFLLLGKILKKNPTTVNAQSILSAQYPNPMRSWNKRISY